MQQDGSPIEVNGIGKRFGSLSVVEELRFQVEAGEVVGLLGPNGAGKTTTLRLLAGLYAPSAGSARVAGEAIVAGRLPSASLRSKVGLLTEAPGFYPRLSAMENLLHFAALYGVDDAPRARAQRLLSRLAMSPFRDRRFSALSRGMKQKLAIARALIHEPQVLLLDEPTVGLDPESVASLRELIAEEAARGCAILLCTHLLDEVSRVCDRAIFMARRVVGIHAVRAAQHALAIRLRPGEARELRVLECLEKLEGAGRARWLEESSGRVLLEAGAGATAEELAPRVAECLVEAKVPILELSSASTAMDLAYLEFLQLARKEGLVE